MVNNFIRKVAIVGAGGHVGSHITQALLATEMHRITAITREDSKSTFPSNVNTKKVDYGNFETLVEALRGQDALVITLSALSPYQDIEKKLVLAAAEANVRWILPNEWSPDSAHEGCIKDVYLFSMKISTREAIRATGNCNFIAVSTGFWYEYSLAIPKCYGFNFAERKVQFYDDGQTKISTSTWPQVGRAVAAILSLPIKLEDNHTSSSLDALKDQVVYVNSFTINQQDMLASACRVTNTERSDWTITSRSSKWMYEQGVEDMKQKNWKGEGNFLYGRVFFPDGCGDFESSKGTLNSVLGLPKEDLDEATRAALKRQTETGGDFH